jgi:cytochrome oxidase Cu insertion factor (SCO1/SenC/PrrC family)/cytochrome c2
MLFGKLLALVVSLFAICVYAMADNSSPWGVNYFPNLPVVTQDGKTLRFYDDVIKGKQVVVSFIYTSCPDICPLTTARLALVKDQLGDLMGRDVFFVSLTVDPEHDTPARMKAMADAFNAGPGWLFLTGKPEDIRAINSKFGNRSAVLSDHRNEIILGNDLTGDWQRDTPFGDIASVVYNIRGMSTKLAVSSTTTSGDANNPVAITRNPGETLFRKICTPCHTVGVGNRVGPDLRDVTKRRSEDWLSAFIMSPGKMRRSGDVVALELDKAFPGVKMPELGLTANDAKDLINYLKAATERLAVVSQQHDHATHVHGKAPVPTN